MENLWTERGEGGLWTVVKDRRTRDSLDQNSRKSYADADADTDVDADANALCFHEWT